MTAARAAGLPLLLAAALFAAPARCARAQAAPPAPLAPLIEQIDALPDREARTLADGLPQAECVRLIRYLATADCADPEREARRLLVVLDGARRWFGGTIEAQSMRKLYPSLVRLGRIREARILLEDVIARAPAPELQANLRIDLAELLRLAGEPTLALEQLDLGSRPGPDGTSELQRSDPLLPAFFLGQRIEICAELGIPDQAEELLAELGAEERRLEAAGLLDPYAWTRFRLHRLTHFVAANREDDALAEVDAARQDPRYGAAGAELPARVALVLAWSARSRPERRDEALAQLRAELARARVEPLELLRLALDEARLLAAAGDAAEAARALAGAERLLAELRQRGAEPAPSRVAAYWSVRTEVAFLGAAPRAEVENLLLAFEDCWSSYLAEWDRTPLRSGGVGFLHHGSRRDVLSDLIRLTLAVHGEATGAAIAFDRVLEAQARGTLSRSLGIAPIRAAEVAARLLVAADHGLLVYVPAAQQSHAFVLDRGGLQCFELARAGQLDAVRSALVPLLAAPLAARDRAALAAAVAAASASFLPAPVAARVLRLGRLSLSGVEQLAWVPFEVFEVDGVPLGTRVALDYLPSIPVAVALAERAASTPPPPLRIALFAAPAHGAAVRTRWPDLRELELDSDDAAALLAPVPDGAAAAALGLGCTLDALGAEPRDVLLELVTHGVRLAGVERSAALLFAETAGDDGVLDVARAEGIAARLVVLGACGAGRARLRRGEDGPQGLAGAFLRGGATAVVLANFDLETKSTLALLAAFNAEIAAGAAPAEALCRARAAVAAEPQWQDPFFHAHLQVVGAGQIPLFAAAPRPRREAGRARVALALLAAAALAAVAVAYAARRRATRSAGSSS